MFEEIDNNEEKESNETTSHVLELIVPTKDLSYILNFANSIVEKRNVLIELSHIKLVAKDGFLEVRATDLDLYLNQKIGSDVKKEGMTTVSTQLLSEIIKKIPDEEVLLKQELDSKHLQIIANSCKFDLLTLPANNFPEMEDLDKFNSLKVRCTELARVIEYTSFAMSNEETRYNLNGIYLHVKNGDFSSAAIDGHRFSVATSTIISESSDFGVIVPKKTVNELLKILKDAKNINSDIIVILGVNKVKFLCNNLTLISKLIDGKFPEYQNFIPNNNEYKLVIATKLLANALERVSIVTIDKFRAIKLIINDSHLTITATGEAKGTASENIPFSTDDEKNYCKFFGKKNIVIGFNPLYIMDVLNTLKEKQVQIYLKNPSSPLLIKTLENPKDNYVVMPLKV